LGQQYGVGTSTAKRVILSVRNLINRHLHRVHVKWPDLEEQARIKSSFYNQKSIPGVIGCVDGVHIACRAQLSCKSAYVNRKQWTSQTVQAVCDDQLRFTLVVTGVPGSCHDAKAFRQAPMWDEWLADTDSKSVLLGDAAYGIFHFLLVPFGGDLTVEQSRFDFYHSSARLTIERAFGKFKGQWQMFNVPRSRAPREEI